MTTRDIGQDDFENTVTVPGPRIRSRFVGTEDVPGHAPETTAAIDERRCPACGQRFPGVAVACPADGADLEPVGAEPDA